MNGLLKCRCWFALLVILAMPSGAPAQVLVRPTGIRSYGLGETGVADAHDPANVFYNPAVLFTLRRIHLGASRTDFPSSDTNLNSLAVSAGYALRRGASARVGVGVDLRYTKLDSGDGTDRFERYYGISLAAGINVDDRYHIGLGGSIKPFKLRDDFFFVGSGIVEGDATAFDVGFLASVRWEQQTGTASISLGASALNLGDDVEVSGGSFKGTSALPEEARVGLGLRFIGQPHPGLTRSLGTPVPAFSLAINFEFELPKGSSVEKVRGGFEAGILSLVFLRAGFLNTLDTGFGASPAETTVGVGLNLPLERFEARLDYARFKPGHIAINRFGATVAFVY